MPRISLFCSIASSCRGVLVGYSRACRPTSGTNITGVLTHLQAGLQDFDEAADLVGDLGARRAELGRADDLTHKWASGVARVTHVPRKHEHRHATR